MTMDFHRLLRSGVFPGMLVAPLWFPAQLVAELYKWTDESGKVHYSDTPPAAGKANKLDLKINSISRPPIISSFCRPSIGAGGQSVKLYSTAWCGYCKQARAYLKQRRVPFEELDVETSAQGKREYESLRGRGVPVILAGTQRMEGFEENALSGILKAAGY